MAETRTKQDWVTPIALVGGIGLLGWGAYLLFKKEGVPPGSIVTAVISFDYLGIGDSYIIGVRLGHLSPIVFTPTLGAEWFLDIDLTEAGQYSFNVKCQLPEGIEAGKYDGACWIRTPDMNVDDYLVRSFAQGAVVIQG